MEKLIDSFRGAPIEQQFDDLVRPHIKYLYQFAYRLAGNTADAEDLVQDILVKLLPKTEEMKSIEKIGPWLARVLYRHFIDHIRKLSRTATASSYREENSEGNYLDSLPATAIGLQNRFTLELGRCYDQGTLRGLPMGV